MMYDNSSQGVADRARSLIASHTATAPSTAVPASNRTDAAVLRIKRYIIENGLHSGDPLPTEAQLCEVLEVSRTSVREALRRLEALDIVASQQGRGSFVGRMSLTPMVETAVLRHAVSASAATAALREVAKTRQYLDLGMAEDVVTPRGAEQKAELRSLVDEMVARAARGEGYMEQDIAFHDGLVRHLDNGLVSQLVQAMWLIHQAVIPNLGPQLPEAMEATAHAHGAILDALEAGDVEAYRAAVRAHYAPLEKLMHQEG